MSSSTAPEQPELLAPAGTIQAGLTAFDAGADAVYAGLKKWNARARGQNLTLEELGKLIAYGRKRGRRVYVTLNTLIKESELAPVADLLCDLWLVRPDAIIVQDLGLVRLLRTELPEIELHASTQMGFHNSAGLSLAARLGIRRVILERQTTFEEIETIARRSPVELEVFVHGALCCSLSGGCLFSSWLGGWSGNRGRCKQPCRRWYSDAGGGGFLLSPGDLSAIERVPRLRQMGLAGLKIEGRLRRPDYVRRVVAACRGLLDAPEGEMPAALAQARAELALAFGREPCPAWRTEADFAAAIRPDSVGASGLEVGRVLESRAGELRVKASAALHLYDSLHVQPEDGEEGASLAVTSLSVAGRSVSRAPAGRVCSIPFSGKVARGSVVFKTGSVTDDLAGRVASLPLAPLVLDLAIRVGDGTLRVEVLETRQAWHAEVELGSARNHPLTAEILEAEWRRSRSGTHAAGRLAIHVDGGVFLPASRLKQLRRAFWQWAEGAVDPGAVRARRASRLGQALRARRRAPEPERRETVVLVRGRDQSPIASAVTARPVETAREGDEVVLPDFCAEPMLAELARRIDELVAAGARRFRVRSLFGLELLRRHEGLRITASFPVQASNSLAVAELRGMGASRVMVWVELEEQAVRELADRAGGDLEAMAYGLVPLLVTRMALPVRGAVQDRRGTRFRVEHEGALTRVLADRPLSIPPPPGLSTFVDLTHASLGEEPTSAFNWRRVLV